MSRPCPGDGFAALAIRFLVARLCAGSLCAVSFSPALAALWTGFYSGSDHAAPGISVRFAEVEPAPARLSRCGALVTLAVRLAACSRAASAAARASLPVACVALASITSPSLIA